MLLRALFCSMAPHSYVPLEHSKGSVVLVIKKSVMTHLRPAFMKMKPFVVVIR
jgi:hypothetical protein